MPLSSRWRFALLPAAAGALALAALVWGVEPYAAWVAPWKLRLAEFWLWAGSLGLLAWALAAPAVEAWLLGLGRGEAPCRAEVRPEGETLLAVALACFMGGLTVAVVRRPGVLPLLACEDGILETLTAAAYLAAAFLFAAPVWRRRGPRRRRRWCALLAVLTFFVFLEEISWGQRLLGFRTPPFLARVNTQGEVTLHNLGATSLLLGPALAAVSLYLGLLPLLARFHPGVAALAARLELPVPRFRTAWLYLLAVASWLGIGLRVGTPGPFPAPGGGAVHLDDECFETWVALLFLLEGVAETGRWPAPAAELQPSP